MQDVEERRIAGPKNTVTIDMRVRRTPFPGNRVHALDVFRTQIIERLADQDDAFVLAPLPPQELVTARFVRGIPPWQRPYPAG